MIYLALFFCALFLLYLLSTSLSKELSSLFYRITRSQRITIYMLAFIFLPGTLVHELSHYLVARLLLVYAGKLELMPKLQEGGVKLGSVAIAQCDPFRRFMIGIAPFLVGTGLIIGMLFYATTHNILNHHLEILLVGYGLFEIGNTMFSSRRDMEGSLKLLGIIALVLILLYFLHIGFMHIFLIYVETPTVTTLLQTIDLYLLIPLVIDVVVIIVLKLLNHLLS